MLNAAGVAATTSILGYSLWDSVKVKRIEVFSPPAAQGSSVTCSILFPATNQSQAREVTDTSVSVSMPAHIVATPPPMSLCSFWNNGNSATTYFTLVAPPGSIIDLTLGLVLEDGNGQASLANTAVLVGATVGGVYYCSLDSSTSAGSIYKPVGLTSL